MARTFTVNDYVTYAMTIACSIVGMGSICVACSISSNVSSNYPPSTCETVYIVSGITVGIVVFITCMSILCKLRFVRMNSYRDVQEDVYDDATVRTTPHVRDRVPYPAEKNHIVV